MIMADRVHWRRNFKRSASENAFLDMPLLYLKVWNGHRYINLLPPNV